GICFCLFSTINSRCLAALGMTGASFHQPFLVWNTSPKTTYDVAHRLVGIDPRGRNVRMVLNVPGGEGGRARRFPTEATGREEDAGKPEAKTGWTNARLSSTG